MHISKQMARFVFVGAFNNISLYLIYLYVTFLGIDHKYAMSGVYVAGVLMGFTFNRRWTFQHNGHISKVFVKYISLYLLGYLLNLTALFMMVDILKYPHQFVQLALSVLLAIMFFILQRFWVFSKRSTITL